MIRVLLADDHTIVRDGLKQILAETGDLVVAGEAADGFDVLRKVREQDWDVLVLDMSMPGRSGIELIKQLKAEKPRLPILVLSMHQEEQYAIRALRSGASGYLTKDTDTAQLVAAIRKVAAGGVYLSGVMAERMAMNLMPAACSLPHTQLSDRELTVFEMLVSGLGVTDIAERLCLSVKTVSTHKSRILQKMNMTSTAELVRYAVKHGLIRDPEG
ncbi:response regulator transcription factor [Pelomicrobium sp.]|jgi:DNA-binding NarL/FixJ family response regulator|uniref:response regulator transcription factor n=1 Tax=Pelomicrobium sp. TaxID=2815319 RepID=UPI002FDEBECB